MASPSVSSSSAPICEGIFAINKPKGISSAQVIRDAQTHFKNSSFFQPWFEQEDARRTNEKHNQKQKRRSWKQRQPLQLKIGHGGTLDPAATGVLILGVGSGTKALGRFLECTKSYEAVVLFGAATDTYDGVGKVVARKNYSHINKDVVEGALSKFRGKIMQRPPIFSALRVKGKHLYEYAREGKEVPVEIEERPMQVDSLEMMEWMEGGSHPFRWPDEEAPKEEKEVVGKVLHLDAGSGAKRKREDGTADGETESEHVPSPKRVKQSPEPTTSDDMSDIESTSTAPPDQQTDAATQLKESGPAPACRIKMTVTSGFYVRSLCHDLGSAVGSLALMANLVRTRQGDFEVGKNVLDYDDLAGGEEVWGPKVEDMLAEWDEKERAEGRGVSESRPSNRGGGFSGKREAKPRMRAKMRVGKKARQENGGADGDKAESAAADEGNEEA